MSKLAEYLYKLRDDKPFYPLYLSVLIIVLLLSPLFAFGTSDKVISLMGGVGGLVGGVFTVLAVGFAFKQYNEQKREMLLQRGKEHIVNIAAIQLSELKSHLETKFWANMNYVFILIKEGGEPFPTGYERHINESLEAIEKIRIDLKRNTLLFKHNQCRASEILNNLEAKEGAIKKLDAYLGYYIEIINFLIDYQNKNSGIMHKYRIEYLQQQIVKNPLYKKCEPTYCKDEYVVNSELALNLFKNKIEQLEDALIG